MHRLSFYRAQGPGNFAAGPIATGLCKPTPRAQRGLPGMLVLQNLSKS
jgi:hypothetical protein